MTMKAKVLKAAVLAGADAAALEEAINAWFAAAGERKFVSLTPLDGGLSVIILFTE